MRKQLTIGLLAVAITLGMASVTAQGVEETGSQEANVSVGVSDITAIDVRPSNLDYNSVTPGEERTSSAGGYEHIEVENIGSARVETIYAQGTMPTEQPFGTDASADTPAQHNTGNFVTMSLEDASGYGISGLSGEKTPHYLNRVEYFEENPPTYITTDEQDDDFNISATSSFEVSNVDVGRFRVGGAEYFFAVYEGGSSQIGLRIGNTPHTSTQLGTTDLSSDGDDYTEYETEQDSDLSGGSLDGSVYRVSEHDFVSFNTSSDSNFNGDSLIEDGNAFADGADITDSSNLDGAEKRNYNLYLDTDDGSIIRTKFNVEQQSPDYDSDGPGWQQSDASGTGVQQYILDADGSDSDALQPGENFPINFGIQVPQGVDQNAINDGTVTLIASGL